MHIKTKQKLCVMLIAQILSKLKYAKIEKRESMKLVTCANVYTCIVSLSEGIGVCSYLATHAKLLTALLFFSLILFGFTAAIECREVSVEK